MADENVISLGNAPIESKQITGNPFTGHTPPIGSAVKKTSVDPKDIPTPKLMRVAEDREITFSAPNNGGHRAKLRAGKIVSSIHYNLDELARQGVKLVSPDQEIVTVPNAVPAMGDARVQLKDMLLALREAGLTVVPTGEKSETEQLRAELAELRAMINDTAETPKRAQRGEPKAEAKS